MADPKIEILVVRDPDDGTDVIVFVDGVEMEVTEEMVDPGAGYVRSEWIYDTLSIRLSNDYSPAFREAVVAARDGAAENYPQYITEEE